MSDTVIEVRDLTKRYGRVDAVDGVSFKVRRGQVYGFLGPNGSGKTTTIGMILGTIRPTRGSVRLFGQRDPQGLHEARQRMGGTFETPSFYPYLSGTDNLRIVANLRGGGDSEVRTAIARVGLAGRERDRFATYSLGMRQRLALAATMIGDPEVVILDEPANGLDPEGMREIREIILHLASEGKTIFLSSHLLWEVERVCTHVAILKRGRIVREDSIARIRSESVHAEVACPDPAFLRSALERIPLVRSFEEEAGLFLVRLRRPDLVALNESLSTLGVYASHLCMRESTLEDAFIEATVGVSAEESRKGSSSRLAARSVEAVG